MPGQLICGDRQVLPEILDNLQPDAPAAGKARNDLLWLNMIMRHAPVFCRHLLPLWSSRPPERLIDIGSGDGRFLLSLLKKLPRSVKPVPVTLLDKNAHVPEKVIREARDLGWQIDVVKGDVFDWLKENRQGAGRAWIMANLFMHHFPQAELSELLTLISENTSLFACCEPRRLGRAMLGARLMPLLAFDNVTCHDARISIRAGFRDKELGALWSDKDSWSLTEQPEGLFTHFFSAVRKKR